MTFRKLPAAPRKLDPSLEKKLIRAMIGVTCEDERWHFRQWLLSVNGIVQKRAWRSIFDLDARDWYTDFATGASAQMMAMLLLDELNDLNDDPRLRPEGPDDYGRDRPPIS